MTSLLSPGTPRTASLLYISLLSLWILRCQGLDISYCSPENNAGDYPAFYSQYQSNGLCQTHCQGSFAFAVLQGSYCWCSNYAPTPQQNTLDCNQECPGFNEWCGSTEAGLFGYFLLSGGSPLGTSGYSTQSSATSTQAPTSTSSVSISTSKSQPTSSLDTGSTTYTRSSVSRPEFHSSFIVTLGSSQSSEQASSVTSSSETSTSSPSSTVRAPAFPITPPAQTFTPVKSFTNTVQTPSSTTPPSTTPSSTTPLPPPPPVVATTSSTSSPTPTPTPTEIYTSVTTVTGEVRTVIVTPTPAASSDATLGQSATGGGVSTGKVVGIVLGVALGIGLLIGLGVWFWFRRRHRRLREEREPETAFVPRTGDHTPVHNTPSRHASQMSSSGLLKSNLPRINTSAGIMGADARSADITTTSAGDRRSAGTDQRLNPYALYMSEQGRISSVSLQDNHDYSRQLRVANPDD